MEGRIIFWSALLTVNSIFIGTFAILGTLAQDKFGILLTLFAIILCVISIYKLLENIQSYSISKPKLSEEKRNAIDDNEKIIYYLFMLEIVSLIVFVGLILMHLLVPSM